MEAEKQLQGSDSGSEVQTVRKSSVSGKACSEFGLIQCKVKER